MMINMAMTVNTALRRSEEGIPSPLRGHLPVLPALLRLASDVITHKVFGFLTNGALARIQSTSKEVHRVIRQSGLLQERVNFSKGWRGLQAAIDVYLTSASR
jgi:hypothetical protein